MAYSPDVLTRFIALRVKVETPNPSPSNPSRGDLMIKKSLLLTAMLGLSAAAIAQTPGVDLKGTVGYAIDQRGYVVKSGTGLCWRDRLLDAGNGHRGMRSGSGEEGRPPPLSPPPRAGRRLPPPRPSPPRRRSPWPPTRCSTSTRPTCAPKARPSWTSWPPTSRASSSRSSSPSATPTASAPMPTT
jgi:hypothetical protein